ncbi:MAG: hypothetical protein FWC39_12905 [Bacteroidetes bacterium]|nr:hypothetical protein [Bacteroidota bacterium]
MIKKLINIAVISFLCTAAYAQNAEIEYDINLMYYNHGDSVSLLWIPSGYDNFRKGVEKGYVVERRAKGAVQWQQQTSALFPISNEAFDRLGQTIEEAAVMQELIYMNDKNAGIVPKDENPTPTSDSYQELTDDGEGDSEEQMMFNFGLITALTNVQIAKASAFFYTDKSVEKGAQYEYRIVLGDGKQADKSQIESVNMTELTKLPKPTDFRGDFGKKDVLFQWSVADLSDIYAAYRLERSLDGKNFVQVNTKPIIYSYSEEEFENTVVFKDVLVDRKTVHHYRMSGYSPFGIYGPPSDVVKGKGTPDFDVQIIIDTIAINNKNEALIRWSVKPADTKLIKGFLIDKARTPEDEFHAVTKNLLPVKDRNYKDKSTMRTSYYRVHAIGYNEGEVVTSFPYFAFQQDSVPPAPPVGLRGTIDSLGVVTLQWDANKEDDILAYRVFASNDNKPDSYLSVSDTLLPNPIYTDTLPLNTLTNEIYYKVVAVDLSYNHSKMSEAVLLMKPDTIPPVKSIILKISQPADNMVIVWENSSSTDAAKLILLRQVSDTGRITIVKEWHGLPKNTTYSDTHHFSGEQVRYFLQTYDKSGNMSEDVSFWQTAKGSLPPCIKHLRATPKHDKATIELQWERGNCEIEKIHIYRQVNNEKTLLLTTINGAQRTFEDKKVKSGETYKYILRAVSERDSPAVYSEEIKY